MLRHHHRLAHCEAEFACRFLLKRRCGEWRCRGAFERFFVYRLYREPCVLALFEEVCNLSLRLEACAEFGFHLCHASVAALDGENTVHTIVWLAVERLYLTFALGYQAYRYALHTAGRQSRFHLAPQYR